MATLLHSLDLRKHLGFPDLDPEVFMLMRERFGPPHYEALAEGYVASSPPQQYLTIVRAPENYDGTIYREGEDELIQVFRTAGVLFRETQDVPNEWDPSTDVPFRMEHLGE